MKELWSSRIRDITPYTPGEQPKNQVFVKLNTNENPYPPSPKVISALTEATDSRLRLYPDPECLSLRQAISDYHQVALDMVFAGNGSDEVLAFCFQAFFEGPAPLRFPDVTYSFYPVYASFFGVPTQPVPLGEDFTLHPQDYCQGNSSGILIANPNAPTGLGIDLAALETIIAANPNCVVLVDEAYGDFGGDSAIPLLEKYPNLLVCRTLSKGRSLAGLRVGYALGHPNLMAALRCVRDSINSYTVDCLAQAGGAAALNDRDYFNTTTAMVLATRARITTQLESLGFHVLPSQANFIFVTHPAHSASALQAHLRTEGVLVRRFDLPRIDNHLRISIGTDEEMDALLASLSKLF